MLSIVGISKIIGILVQAVGAGLEAKKLYELGRDAFSAAVDSGKDPTDAELRANMDRIKGRSGRIQNA